MGVVGQCTPVAGGSIPAEGVAGHTPRCPTAMLLKLWGASQSYGGRVARQSWALTTDIMTWYVWGRPESLRFPKFPGAAASSWAMFSEQRCAGGNQWFRKSFPASCSQKGQGQAHHHPTIYLPTTYLWNVYSVAGAQSTAGNGAVVVPVRGCICTSSWAWILNT